MLAGLIAGLLVFAFARWTGEPQIERAIAFETNLDRAKDVAPEPEIVSRRIQKSLGLLAGTIIYGTAVGGLFGLVFAFAYGRIGITEPRALSAVLAALGFIAVVLVPNLKYPANPPAVGNPDTIGVRTAAFFLLITLSVAATVLSIQIARSMAVRFGVWNSSLLGAGVFVVVMSIVLHLLPEIDEVPAGFPVTLMWRFRVASLEIQAVLWSAIGLLFGWFTERGTVLHQLSKSNYYSRRKTDR
jgi:predicted cobalt transporter CbtA